MGGSVCLTHGDLGLLCATTPNFQFHVLIKEPEGGCLPASAFSAPKELLLGLKLKGHYYADTILTTQEVLSWPSECRSRPPPIERPPVQGVSVIQVTLEMCGLSQ